MYPYLDLFKQTVDKYCKENPELSEDKQKMVDRYRQLFTEKDKQSTNLLSKEEQINIYARLLTEDDALNGIVMQLEL